MFVISSSGLASSTTKSALLPASSVPTCAQSKGLCRPLRRRDDRLGRGHAEADEEFELEVVGVAEEISHGTRVSSQDDVVRQLRKVADNALGPLLVSSGSLGHLSRTIRGRVAQTRNNLRRDLVPKERVLEHGPTIRFAFCHHPKRRHHEDVPLFHEREILIIHIASYGMWMNLLVPGTYQLLVISQCGRVRDDTNVPVLGPHRGSPDRSRVVA